VESAKRQVVDDRKKAEHETPTCIKSLKPLHKGVWLTWDFGQSAFEAYYPAGRPTKSCGFGWLGPNCRASNTLHALELSLNFLWDNHRDKGRDCSLRPSPECIRDALAEAQAEIRELEKLNIPSAYRDDNMEEGEEDLGGDEDGNEFEIFVPSALPSSASGKSSGKGKAPPPMPAGRASRPLLEGLTKAFLLKALSWAARDLFFCLSEASRHLSKILREMSRTESSEST
jgi:hypothetical protein